MLTELGSELKHAREQARLSLESAATPANISAAYLHKLERGVVNSPSPRVLARLAAPLKLPYLRLLELAGYLDEEQLAKARLREPAVHPHPLAGQQLTFDEWQEVAGFIKELLARRVQA